MPAVITYAVGSFSTWPLSFQESVPVRPSTVISSMAAASLSHASSRAVSAVTPTFLMASATAWTPS